MGLDPGTPEYDANNLATHPPGHDYTGRKIVRQFEIIFWDFVF